MTTHPPAPAVRVAGLHQRFGTAHGDVHALSGIDLDIAPGAFVSLIGPSGCGKSTLLRCIADLVQPTAGSVEVGGRSAHEARLAHHYGIAFQQAGLLEWRTVQRNVELPLELHGVGRRERAERARQLLGLVGLSDVARMRPSELSGGMQQRVAIARSLAEEPPLLLMDEPFGALDEMTRERLQAELLAIRARTGTTVVFVTHSISEAVFLSTQVVVMSARPGRVVRVVDVDLPDRAEATREDPAFFAAITDVREALRGGTARTPALGGEDR
ncbi:ABC transporter ATP-binding protein [Kineococcus sp. TBRC 1896]|uniref:ABC transporter ATP-binding protein n=1 Tax=Kineococcus mangrovi TaxID=1660183 RepID=A0ABV4I631_9ACTN